MHKRTLNICGEGKQGVVSLPCWLNTSKEQLTQGQNNKNQGRKHARKDWCK